MRAGSAVDKISLWDFKNYLPEDILTKLDRTTMAVSIEGREPLLDHRIAEYAFRLLSGFVSRASRIKYVFDPP